MWITGAIFVSDMSPKLSDHLENSRPFAEGFTSFTTHTSDINNLDKALGFVSVFVLVEAAAASVVASQPRSLLT